MGCGKRLRARVVESLPERIADSIVFASFNNGGRIAKALVACMSFGESTVILWSNGHMVRSGTGNSRCRGEAHVKSTPTLVNSLAEGVPGWCRTEFSLYETSV